MAHVDGLTLVSASQIADTDLLYIGRPGDPDPDRRTLVSSLASKLLEDPSATYPFYEEGTWTPILTTTSGDVTATYTSQTGTYTRIGTRVLAEFTIVLSAITGAATQARVRGLPYNRAAGTPTGLFAGYFEGVTLAGVQSVLDFGDVSYLRCVNINSGSGPSSITTNSFANSSSLRASLSYVADLP